MLIILVAASVRRASSGAHKSISRIEKQILEKMHSNTKVSHKIFQYGPLKSSSTYYTSGWFRINRTINILILGGTN